MNNTFEKSDLLNVIIDDNYIWKRVIVRNYKTKELEKALIVKTKMKAIRDVGNGGGGCQEDLYGMISEYSQVHRRLL
jgi:hypothetical protein